MISICGMAGIGLAIVALWSVLAWYDGEPFREMFSVQILAMGISFTAFLALLGVVVVSWPRRRAGVQESS